MKRRIGVVIGVAGVLAGTAAVAGELGDQCAWGLVNGKRVKTDCAVSQMGPDGKTYCFSNEQVKWYFMGDLEGNIQKAKAEFARK